MSVKDRYKGPYVQCAYCGAKLKAIGRYREAMEVLLAMGVWLICEACSMELPFGASSTARGVKRDSIL